MRRFSTSPGAAGGTNQAFDSFSRREVTGSHGVARRAVTGSHGVARGSPEETSRRSCSAHSDGDLGGKLSTVGVSWLGSVHLSGCGARGSSNKDPSPAPRLLNPLRKEMRRVKGHRDQAGSDWDASPDSHSGSPQPGRVSHLSDSQPQPFPRLFVTLGRSSCTRHTAGAVSLQSSQNRKSVQCSGAGSVSLHNSPTYSQTPAALTRAKASTPQDSLPSPTSQHISQVAIISILVFPFPACIP